MILTFADKSGSSLKKNADLIIKDTISQSQLLEDLLQEAPAILEGYAGFRISTRSIMPSHVSGGRRSYITFRTAGIMTYGKA